MAAVPPGRPDPVVLDQIRQRLMETGDWDRSVPPMPPLLPSMPGPRGRVNISSELTPRCVGIQDIEITSRAAG